MKKLLSNIALTYAASGLGFLAVILSARLLGAEQYTWVALGLALGGFIVPVAGLGSQRTFVRDAVAAHDIEAVREIVQNSFGMRFTAMLFIAAACISGSFFFTTNPIEIIALSSFTVWVGLQGLYPDSWFDYSHSIRLQNWAVLFERIAAIAIIGVVYLLPNEQMNTALLGLFLLLCRIASIVYQIKKWWSMNGEGVFKVRLILPLKKTPGINFRITLTLVANAVLTHGNQLLLKDASAVELSAYSLSFQIVTLIFLFQNLVIRLQSRKIAEVVGTGRGIIKAFFVHAGVTTMGSALFGGAAYILTIYLPHFLADTRYTQMHHFMSTLWPWITIVGAGQTITQYMVTLHQENFYLLTGVIGGVIAFGLGLIFVPSHGAQAVAIILLLVHGSMILMSLIKLMFEMGQRGRKVEECDNDLA